MAKRKVVRRAKSNAKKTAAPKAKASKKASAKSTKATPRVRRMDEKALIAKYPQVVKGSLKFNKVGRFAGKQTVSISCAHPKCKERRTVATSDLFQISMCSAHLVEARKARRAAARARAAA